MGRYPRHVYWLAFALAIEVIPATIPQGRVLRVNAPAEAASVRFSNRTIPLFPNQDGSRSGLVPVPALARPGIRKLEVLDSEGRVLETTTVTIRNAKFLKQNVRLGKSLTQLKASPGEMETVSAVRKTVTPDRHWDEPFQPPLPGCITSPYGVTRLHNGKPTGSYHSGLDQRGAAGTPIRAIAGGVVRIAQQFNIHGGTVGIDHGQGVVSFYLHMSGFETKEGSTVSKGDVIGYVGSTGRSTAPHLHWGLNVHGTPVNPLQWMKLTPCKASPATSKRK
jgi:murein DD-endopeptidase MepM/ murein hydrolase activator NlpD